VPVIACHDCPPEAESKSIIRAVASSTAIETGQRISDLEVRLGKSRSRSSSVSFAIKPTRLQSAADKRG
jgi:hypothetical protein